MCEECRTVSKVPALNALEYDFMSFWEEPQSNFVEINGIRGIFFSNTHLWADESRGWLEICLPYSYKANLPFLFKSSKKRGWQQQAAPTKIIYYQIPDKCLPVVQTVVNELLCSVTSSSMLQRSLFTFSLDN